MKKIKTQKHPKYLLTNKLKQQVIHPHTNQLLRHQIFSENLHTIKVFNNKKMTVNNNFLQLFRVLLLKRHHPRVQNLNLRESLKIKMETKDVL